jgi:hypothetical protein
LKGPWCQSRCLFNPVSVMNAHRTTRRNASRSCSMRPNPLHGVGARFSQVGLRRYRRKPMLGAGSCRLAIGPERAVPVRMTWDARGRTRPSEAPPAVPTGSVRGVGTGAKSSTGSERSLHNVPRRGASVTRDRPKRARLTARHLIRDPGARTLGTRKQPPIERRYCLIALPCEPRNRRRVMRGLVKAPGMARSGSSRR